MKHSIDPMKMAFADAVARRDQLASLKNELELAKRHLRTLMAAFLDPSKMDSEQWCDAAACCGFKLPPVMRSPTRRLMPEEE